MLRQRIDVILIGIFLAFFGFFIIKASISIITTPFYDFDEAHRAETAKRMKEYKSFFVPLTGSVYDRIETLKIPFKEDPHLFLYYHLERPPLMYILMIASMTIFGDAEWAYRLPSLILSVAMVMSFVIFAKVLTTKMNIPALLIGLLTLITSADFWLSSQYAQLDPGINKFLFLSLLVLITYCTKKRNIFIIISGILFALAVLAKGQPAIILVFPILYLIIIKKLSLLDIAKFILGASLLLVPWITYLTFTFGIQNVVNTFFGFAIAMATQADNTYNAPFFWYVRWWFTSFRPGWTLFLVLVVHDILKRKIKIGRSTIIVYVFGTLLFYSSAGNKLWWYVLPVIPAMSFYIYLSLSSLLKEKKYFVKLSIILLLGSLPIFLDATSRLVLLYGVIATGIALFVFLSSYVEEIFRRYKINAYALHLLVFAELFTLIFFSLRFPKVEPYNSAEKPVAKFYRILPGKKCLWFKNMPSEAILFYSNAGGVKELTENVNIFPHCQNYLITPVNIKKDEATYRNNINQKRYLRDGKIVKEIGSLKLVELSQ